MLALLLATIMQPVRCDDAPFAIGTEIGTPGGTILRIDKLIQRGTTIAYVMTNAGKQRFLVSRGSAPTANELNAEIAAFKYNGVRQTQAHFTALLEHGGMLYTPLVLQPPNTELIPCKGV